MCLILTICAALAFSGVYFYQKKNSAVSKSVFAAMLMFWGASLMWSMDGVASVLEGEGFFDLSASDAALGAVVVLAALAVWVVRLLIADPLNVIGKKLSTRG